MTDTFLISDLHLGHEATWARFKKLDGSPLRPFSSTEEMNEAMIENWNKTVHPKDMVYVLGDVVMSKKWLPLVTRLQGRKRLVGGNHDHFMTSAYQEVGFEKIMGCREMDGLILTHIPVHTNQLIRFRGNVHGHLHDKIVYKTIKNPDYDFEASVWEPEFIEVPDERYFNVSVERINFTPISFDVVRKHFNE